MPNLEHSSSPVGCPWLLVELDCSLRLLNEAAPSFRNRVMNDRPARSRLKSFYLEILSGPTCRASVLPANYRKFRMSSTKLSTCAARAAGIAPDVAILPKKQGLRGAWKSKPSSLPEAPLRVHPCSHYGNLRFKWPHAGRQPSQAISITRRRFLRCAGI